VEKRGWADEEKRRLKETGSVHHSKSTNVPVETNKKRGREEGNVVLSNSLGVIHW